MYYPWSSRSECQYTLVENLKSVQPRQTLDERERLQRLILEHAPAGLVTVEAGGRLRSVTPWFCRMLGFTADELLSRTLQDLVPEEDIAGAAQLVDQLMNGRLSQEPIEGRLICRDSSVMYAEFQFNPLPDRAGEPQRFIGLVRDITTRIDTEAIHSRREELLRKTFENAPIGMGVVDRERRIRHANPALCAMLGYDKAELESLGVDDITHPADREETQRLMQDLWNNALDHYMVEKRFLRKDGGAVHCQSHVSVVRDDGGAPQMAIGQVVDISGRVRAARDLESIRTYLKNIIDSMPSMLVVVDRTGTVTRWNPVAAQLSGIAAEDAVGRPIGELLPLSELWLGQITAAFGGREPVKGERLPLILNGRDRIFDLLAYPLLSDDTDGAVVRLDDVSDKVQMQEMMVQTEKMLSVGGLAAGMAHEINNPLGAILQSCQNIRRRLSESLPANQQVAAELGLDLALVQRYMESRSILQFLDRIQESGDRAANIVADMLSFSRCSELHFEPLDPAELMEKALRLASSDFDLRKKYDIKRVVIERDYDPELGPVECDRTEIEQVLLNLVVNAAHAMASQPHPAEASKIVLRTRLEEGYARLEVIDNGPGMDENTRSRIFEPFYTTKAAGTGTGLGLSVSYFIVYDQHKGSMQVESAPGEGARFIIRLPLRQR